MTKLLESGDLQNHINRVLQPAYARRYRGMIMAIEQFLVPLGVTLPQVDRKEVGGYFIWLKLPERIHAGLVTNNAKQHENLTVAPGPLFDVPGDGGVEDLSRYLRVCFAWEDEYTLTRGIGRLGRVIANIAKAPPPLPLRLDSLVNRDR